MVELAKCPACGRLAAGASEWPADQPVRCPRCQAEFAFGRAIEQSLPQLIALTPGQETTPTTPVDKPPAPLELPPPQETQDSTPTQPQEPETFRIVETPPQPETYRIIETPPAPLPTSYAAAYDFLPLEKKRQLETAAAVASRLRGTTTRRRRNWFAELLKMLLGALVGLTAGYWALNYFGGQRFAWLPVYRPACPPTDPHGPAQYRPWTQVEGSTKDDGRSTEEKGGRAKEEDSPATP